MAEFFSGGRSDTRWPASCSASCGTSTARAGAGERHDTRQLRQSLVFASPVLSFTSAPVLAQMLVSSIGQTRAGFIRDASNHAQTFTTGGDSNSLRYNLSSVDVQFAANQNAVVYDSLVVTIRCRSSHGFPGEIVATLTKLPFLGKIYPEEHVLNFTTCLTFLRQVLKNPWVAEAQTRMMRMSVVKPAGASRATLYLVVSRSW